MVAAESDLEQPLLPQSPTAVEPIKEVPEAAAPEELGQSAFSWWDASMQATLAAVLCLWALKLVQQGYVDGESAKMSISLSLARLPCCPSVEHTRGLLQAWHPVPMYQDALVSIPTAAVQRQHAWSDLKSGASDWTVIYYGHAVCGSLISHSRSLLCAGLPIFTGPIYGWSGSEPGLLLAVLGIASIPLSFLVGYMSPHISDRSLTAAALLATLLGAALCTRAGNAHDPAAYFGGGAILYMVRDTLSVATVLMS